MVRLPTAVAYGVTRADFPEQDWSVWESHKYCHPGLGQMVDTKYLNVWPCCIHCATWICSGCWDFRRMRASRSVSQYCPKCGGREGFFSATRHGTRNSHAPAHVPRPPFMVPRMSVIREGDPRYNLTQDLVEGDSHRQNWAMNVLDATKHMNPVQAGIYIDQHSYRPDPERIKAFYLELAESQRDRRLWENQVSNENAMGLDPEEKRGWGVKQPDELEHRDPGFSLDALRPDGSVNDEKTSESIAIQPAPLGGFHFDTVEERVYGSNVVEAMRQKVEEALANGCQPGDRLTCTIAEARELIASRFTKYPYDDGEVVVLGPEIFVNPEAEVISWKGENWVKQQKAVEAPAYLGSQKREALEYAIRAAAPASSTQRPVDRTAQIVDTADAILAWLQK